jgi:nitrite reductase (NADH) small subunit
MTTQVVGTVDEIPIGEGRAFAVDGTQVAVYRLRDGSLRALGAVCPHKGGPLADGLMDGRVVVCPLHGHTYDLTTGTELGGNDPACAYPVTAAEDGTILLETGTR